MNNPYSQFQDEYSLPDILDAPMKAALQHNLGLGGAAVVTVYNKAVA